MPSLFSRLSKQKMVSLPPLASNGSRALQGLTAPYCIIDTEEIILRNVTAANSLDEPRNAVEIETIASIAIAALLVHLIFSLKYNFDDKLILKIRVPQFINAKTISTVTALILLLISIPFLVAVTLLAIIYKGICTLIIKSKDQSYAGLLDSFDVFWSLEDDTTKSIIKIFGTIESESAEHLLYSIKEKLQTVFMKNDDSMGKIFHRRSEEYGFYYWRRYSDINLDEYVQIVENRTKTELNEKDLEHFMSKCSRKPLPYNDEGLFQVIITGNKVVDDESTVKSKPTHGIIFKIHHSLGDGVALIEFLCQNLADGKKTVFNPNYMIQKQKPDSASELIDKIYKLSQIPICFVKGIIRIPDENSLHGPALTGDTVFAWTRSDENLLHVMKDIKDKVEGIKCTDVLIAALSSGLRKLLAKKMTSLPKDIAVVLPIRFPRATSDGSLKLENNFSVTILDVPIEQEAESGRGRDIIQVKRRCDELRKSADPLTNYFFLKLVGGMLPNTILKPMLVSKHATMVLSNLPGPETLTIFGGNLLRKLVFFVPNKGKTGLGVTALSYGGVLRFAASADRALVSDAEELRVILDGMVEEVRRLHNCYCSK